MSFEAVGVALVDLHKRGVFPRLLAMTPAGSEDDGAASGLSRSARAWLGLRDGLRDAVFPIVSPCERLHSDIPHIAVSPHA
jgi:hypothetical protein